METFCKCGKPVQTFRNGYRGQYCKACREIYREEYNLNWNKNNPDKIKARQLRALPQRKQYRLANPELIRAQKHEHYLKHKEQIKIRDLKYRSKNIEEIKKRMQEYSRNNRESINLSLREKYRKNSSFRLAGLIRTRIREALKENQKAESSEKLVGCLWSELRMWLEFQFQDGMTWENHGSIWHIDHIRPCVSFDLTDPEQQKECFNYKNLQPLFKFDNLSKGGTYFDKST